MSSKVTKAYNRAYYLKNREAIRKKQKEYYGKDYKEKIAPKKKERYQKTSKAVIANNRKFLEENRLFCLWRGAKYRAVSKGIPFDIEVADLTLPAYCPVFLGIKLEFSDKLRDNSPTLDRVDSTRGYVKGNVRIISWKANRLKSDMTVAMVKAILNYMEQK